MNLKGILFDFNGTLLFDSDMHVEAFIRTYRHYGLTPPDFEYMMKSFFGKPNRFIYAENFNPSYTEEELKAFISFKENAYYDVCRELGDGFRLAKGAEEMLNYLKEAGIPYCLATGSEGKTVDFYMEHLDLGRWFEYGKNIVYEDGSFHGKPAPDIYNIAAARLGLTPAECLIFEDATTGIMAANAARAGAVIAVYNEKYPSPLTDGIYVDRVYHDHCLWKHALADYGLLR